jgi:hypothetical protein
MSDETSLTLAHLLPDPIEGLSEQLKTHAGEHGGGAVPWGLVEGDAVKGLQSELGKFGLFDMLAGAWVTIDAIRAFRDPAKAKAGETNIVPLGQHSVALTAEPALSLVIAGFTLPPLRLGLVATAIFESVHIHIKDTHLIAASPGKCTITAGLNCGSIPLRPAKELAKLELPGAFHFPEPGWKIP